MTYFTDFDEWANARRNQLQHEKLTIPASGTLIDGLYNDSLKVFGNQGQHAEVTYILESNTRVKDACFGE